jgi:outer membrane lipoprotein-sorting protein
MKIILFAVIFLTILSGCATTKPNVENMPTPDTRSVLLTLKTRYDLAETMRTLVNIKMESQGKSDEVRGYLNYAKPDKLSIFIMGPFNEPRVIATVAGESLRMYFVAENELIEDKLTDIVMKTLFNVDLRVSDIRSAIFANPFLDGNTDNLKIERYDSQYMITRPSGQNDYSEEILFSAKDTTINKWRIKDASGKLIQEIAFSKYRDINGILRPLKAVVYRTDDLTKITIESIDPEVNVKLADDIFDLSIPEDAKIYKLSDLKMKEPPSE